MCFSSNASFGASAVLAVVGVVAIAKAKNTPGRLFAAIPFIFSIQQFAEGMLWLSMKEHDIGGMGGMSNFSTNHPSCVRTGTMAFLCTIHRVAAGK